MDMKSKYSLADFNDYAPANDSLGFALISHASFYAFEKKSFIDKKGVQQRRRMVHVGPYFLGDGLKEVWALATGLSIKYYYGYAHAHQLVRVEDRYKSHIYYRGINFRFLAAHESETRERARAYGKILVEIVINYIFLAGRKLGYVKNEHRTNMLADFANACISYPERKEQESSKDRASGIKTEPLDDSNGFKLSFQYDSFFPRRRQDYQDKLYAELEREREACAKLERVSRDKAAQLKAERLRAHHQERALKKKLKRSKQRSVETSEVLFKATQAFQAVLGHGGSDESSPEGSDSELDQEFEEDKENGEDGSYYEADLGMYQDDDNGELGVELPRKVGNA